LKNVALITYPAIGDSLLLMTVAHNFRQHGARVTVFGPHVHTLRAWFPGLDIQPSLPADTAAARLAAFDMVMQLHDDRPFADLGRLHPCAFTLEHLCRQRSPKSMALRLAEFCRAKLDLAGAVKYNGICAPTGLHHRQHALRVAIHPTASTQDKCWLPQRFIALARHLRRKGFDPHFVVSPAERPQWTHVQELGLGLPDLGSLDNVAAWMFESGWFIGNDSGIGHLASSLHVPTLSLFKRLGSAQTWRPDWGPGRIVIGSAYIPAGRLKERIWKYALTPGRAARAFARLHAEQQATAPAATPRFQPGITPLR